jgi:hypothetical protein
VVLGWRRIVLPLFDVIGSGPVDLEQRVKFELMTQKGHSGGALMNFRRYLASPAVNDVPLRAGLDRRGGVRII